MNGFAALAVLLHRLTPGPSHGAGRQRVRKGLRDEDKDVRRPLLRGHDDARTRPRSRHFDWLVLSVPKGAERDANPLPASCRAQLIDSDRRPSWQRASLATSAPIDEANGQEAAPRKSGPVRPCGIQVESPPSAAMRTSNERIIESVLLLGLGLTATFPLFVETYRMAAFNTVPRDDYAPFLLWLADSGGRMPGAPMCYRILSVAIALPFFWIVPAYRFSELVNPDAAYLRATQSLALVSWFALVGVSLVVFRIARDRFQASRASALASFLALPLYASYASLTGVDPLAMLFIASGYYWLQTARIFVPLVLVSGFFNEKVALVFALLLGARVLADRQNFMRKHRAQMIACGVALAGYMVTRQWLAIPGNEKQMQPSEFLNSARQLLELTFTMKGLVQNVFPSALCLAAFALVRRYRETTANLDGTAYDIAVPIGLIAIGIAINVTYTLGRLVMHAVPLVLPAACIVIDRWGEKALVSRANPTALRTSTSST